MTKVALNGSFTMDENDGPQLADGLRYQGVKLAGAVVKVDSDVSFRVNFKGKIHNTPQRPSLF